ncbi:MAG: hypothetical protein R6V00_00775 [Candidatus Aminicenantes bacterium]
MEIYLKSPKRATTLVVMLALFVLTQPLCPQWALRYDNSFASPTGKLTATNDGGYIFPCLSTIVKLSSTGSLEWQYFYFGGLYSTDIFQTHDGGYVVTGATYGLYGKTDDIIVVKLSPWGEMEWHSTYRTNNVFMNERAFSIIETSDQGFMIAGYLVEYGPWDSDRNILVLKLSSSGGIEWNKVFDFGGLDMAYSVEQTVDRGFILAGHVGAIRHQERLYMWILKLDSSGGVEWQKVYGGDSREGAYSVQQTSDGGFVAAGFERSLPGKGGALVLKLFPDGEIEWQRCFKRNKPIQAKSIRQTLDQGYVVSGSGNEEETDIWFFKINSVGQMEWGKSFDREKKGGAYSIEPLSTGDNIILAEIMEKEWTENPVILKTTSSGDIDPACQSLQDLNIGILESHVSSKEIYPVYWEDSFLRGKKDLEIKNTDGRSVALCGEPQILDLYPPIEFSVETVMNRSLFFIEYINKLTWAPNPENNHVQKYRVYQLDKGSKTLIAEVDSDKLSCLHRNIQIKQTYKYIIVSVDESGRESYPHYTAITTVEPQGSFSQKYEKYSPGIIAVIQSFGSRYEDPFIPCNG